MIIHQDFGKLPPKAFLLQILNETAKLYVFLWEKKDSMNKIKMTWKEISHYYHKNMFKTSLRKLNNEGLLDYEASDDSVSIELVDWEDVAEGL